MIETLINEWASYAQSLDPIKLYGGAILAIAVILFLIRVSRNCQPKNLVAYSTEGGRVIINRSAIVDLVQSACAQVSDVSRPKVRIRIKKGIPHFKILIRLSSGGMMRAIEQNLQSHLREALSQNLGIEKLGQIDVVATGFKNKAVAKALSSNISNSETSNSEES